MRTPVAKMMMSVVNQSSIFMGRNVSVDCCMLVLIVLFFFASRGGSSAKEEHFGFSASCTGRDVVTSGMPSTSF